jgi:hypothetical protein
MTNPANPPLPLFGDEKFYRGVWVYFGGTMREDEALDLVKKVKRKRPDKAEEWKLHTEPGELGQMIQNAMAIYNLPDIDTNNEEQVRERIGVYFKLCAEREMKPSVSGMAMALGVDRMTLWKWVNGAVPSKPKAVIDTVKKAYHILNFMIEEYMQNGKINPVSGIFLMKNNFGYRDQSEVVITPNQANSDVPTQAEIEARYRDALPSAEENSSTIILDELETQDN